MSRTHRKRAARAGFTLLELMVALVVGLMAIGTMYAIMAAMMAFFTEQHRIAVAQSSLRHAMEEIRRDVVRAGFGATPTQALGGPYAPPIGGQVAYQNVRAIQVLDAVTPAGPGNLIQPTGDANTIDGQVLQGDTLILMGNYATSNDYKGHVERDDTVTVKSDTVGFVRDFSLWAAGNYAPNAALFGTAFTPGRLLRVGDSQGRQLFARIGGFAIVPGPPPEGSLNVDSAAGLPLGSDVRVNPVCQINYNVQAALVGSASFTPPAGPSGVNVQLVRQEMDFATNAPLAGQPPRVVAERVVHFNVDYITNTAATRNQQPVLAPVVPATAAVATERVVSAIITLALRTPHHDRAFPWVAQDNALGEELTRFRFINNIGYASRVRVQRAEVFLPNVAYPWVRN